MTQEEKDSRLSLPSSGVRTMSRESWILCSFDTVGELALKEIERHVKQSLPKGERLPTGAFSKRRSNCIAKFGSGESRALYDVALPMRILAEDPWELRWIPVNGGSAKDCPLLWSIHH